MNELVCKRCSWKWTPRVENVKQCPGCHSTRWNQYRKRDLNPAPVTKPSGDSHVDLKEEK